ncbi:hypothetical protein [Marinovum sp.]|uniref:hypothetical protein n=1 Tax=Marinovum sp. TaxID=2024839 RepID=UPI003A8D53AA
MPFKEITDCVQRLEMLEEAAGIEIGGLMVTVGEDPDDGEYRISILGEITAPGGGRIDSDVEINFNCYNANRQVCGTTTAYLLAESFMGLETLDETIYSKGVPVEMKIIPKVIR